MIIRILLARLSGREMINAGVPGELSQEDLQRLAELLDEYQLNLSILKHGGSDILRKFPAAQAQNNLKAMIDEAKQCPYLTV